ncbi:MAG: tetratricopeptide repeat protein [Thermodesulfobacteriota bacterium]
MTKFLHKFSCSFLLILTFSYLFGGETWAEVNSYQKAITFIKAGQYRQALPFLEKALQETPEDLFLKGDYLLCLIWTEAYEKAVQFYIPNEKELLKLKYIPKHIARAFMELKEYAKARALYEKAWEFDRTDQEALKGLIFSLHFQGNYGLAYSFLEKSEKYLPDLTTFLRALTLEKEGRITQAYKLYGQLTLKIEEETLLKEIKERRQELVSSLSQEDFHLLFEEVAAIPLLPQLLLIDTRNYKEALKKLPADYTSWPLGFLMELGWAFFKDKRYEASLNLFQFITNKYQGACLPRILIVYPWAMMGKVAEGQQVLNALKEKNCFLIDILFAQAFLYERDGDYFSAFKTYEEILKLRPRNMEAQKLRIYNLAELGATSLAEQELLDKGIKDEELQDFLEGNKVIDQLRWDQAKHARFILEKKIKENPQNLRAHYDYLIVLRHLQQMQEVLLQYEKIKSLTQEIPPWVLEAVAEAYLYLEKPQKALEIYDQALAQEKRINSLMGRFYAFQDLRDWARAEKALQEVENFLKNQKPDKWTKVARVLKDGWFLPYQDRLKETLEYYETCFGYLESRGWFLIHQDKLKEAEDFFASYLSRAGFSLEFRNGLAHTYLSRGRPRQALEEFKIMENINPEFQKGLTGMALTLNALNYKKEARDLAKKLADQYPTNKHMQNTLKTFQIEDMWNVYAEGGFIQENPGAREYWAKFRLTEPLIPNFKLFQEILWQEATEGDTNFTWNRAALGAEWIVFPELIWKQAVTFDYQKMRDWGYATTLYFWPIDPLRFTAGFDSFSTGIPVRARAAGIEGKNIYLNIHYLESDLRYYGATVGADWFSDDNQRVYGQLYYDQNIFNWPDFKIRLGGEIYYGGYQKSDVPYFSPPEEFSFLLTTGFHWLPYLFYEKEVRSSLYGRIGMYKQRDYSFYPIGGVTYEMRIKLSKTFYLQGSISWDQKVYDGSSAGVWSGLLSLSKSF